MALLAVLPAVNWVLSAGTIPFTDLRQLYSLKWPQRHLNRWLYRQGISADAGQVLVGRDGWLFLGDDYTPVLNNTQGITGVEVSAAAIAGSIQELKDRQRWLTDKGIMALLVIAPNKKSIYSENLPAGTAAPEPDGTDDFVTAARVAGLNLLDLRARLLAAKTASEPTYYKTDRHWNNLGAYLAYRDTMAALNDIYGARMQADAPLSRRWIMRGGGDLAQLLKIDTLLDPDTDRDVKLSFTATDAILCLQKLSADKLAPRGACEKTTNRGVRVARQPLASFNPQALNRMNVLWVRDSFGEANSMLYQQTFSRLWQVHYKQFATLDWRAVVTKLKPDLVIYQVAERALYESAD